MKLYIFIILFLVMLANVNSTFSAVNCSQVKPKSAYTVCNITGIKTSCEQSVSTADCDKALTKFTHINWEKLSIKKNISSITVKADGGTEVSLTDSDSFVFLPNVSYQEIAERLGADLGTVTVLASNTFAKVERFSSNGVPCPQAVVPVVATNSRKEKSFWTILDEIHQDAYSTEPVKYFKQSEKKAEGSCSLIQYRATNDGQYNWVKQGITWEIDTSTLAQRFKGTCNRTLDGKDWESPAVGNYYASAYGLFNFSQDGKKWSVNYDFRNKEHDDSKKSSKVLLASDGVKISGDNESSVSDDAYGMGFSMGEIKTCEFTPNEIKTLEAKIAKAKKRNADWKKLSIYSCRFEPDQIGKVRNEWKEIQKKVLAKCMKDVAPIVAGSTSTCNNPDSDSGLCNDAKDLDASSGIPGMTIKNCSDVEVDGKRYPHLYVVERLEHGKRYAYGSANIENVERKGKKSATLVYNWEYDNAAKATFTQAGGAQKIPKTIQGESKLPVFIDDNDNVVGLKSNCFRHAYTRTSDGGKLIGDGGAFYNREGGGIEKLECVN